VIPRSLFNAVAQILAMLFQLKNKEISQLPDFTSLSVPDNLKQAP
jgi:hypothetical protein